MLPYTPAQTFGQYAERLAAAFLVKKGFLLVAQNFRYKQFEIDLIVREDALMVFVEVKARKSNLWGNPESFITPKKSMAVRKAAIYYIHTHRWYKAIRFDIIAILGDKYQNNLEIVHLEDGFY